MHALVHTTRHKQPIGMLTDRGRSKQQQAYLQSSLGEQPEAR